MTLLRSLGHGVRYVYEFLSDDLVAELGPWGQIRLYEFLSDDLVADSLSSVQEQAVHVLDRSASLAVVADQS